MKVLLAGGGTAGHINPALAIAGAIRKHDKSAEIMFAGNSDGMESQLVRKAGYAFSPIKVKGFWRGFAPEDILHNLKAVKCLMTSPFEAKKIIQEFQPDIVIGTGGYVSGPVVLSAIRAGIKTLIHEQNAFPGVTTKLLAKKADVVCLAVEEAKKYLEISGKVFVTGNPVRENIIYKSKAEARKELGMDDKLCILSFGGSLGALAINKIAADLIEWHYKDGKINHIHGYGQLGAKLFPELMAQRGIDLSNYPRIDVRQYIDNMDTCLAAADLVICRSGAITLSELEAAGKASILVPSPTVTENHQYHNAMVLADHHAAIVIEEAKYDKQAFLSIIRDLLINPEKLMELSKNASALAVFDTSEQIYQIITDLLSKA